MNQISNENKLQTTLQIPVSKVEFCDSYAILYSDGKNIGTVPVTSVGITIVFDTAEQIINNLKWGIIFTKYKETFTTLVKDQTSETEVVVVPAMFGHIYARNSKGQVIGYLKCTYDGAD